MKDVLSVGQCYYYLNIPNNCDIENIRVLHGFYKSGVNLDLYYYSKDLSSITLGCDAIKGVIRDNFKNSRWIPTSSMNYYWVTLDNQSHFRTLHIKNGNGNCYSHNYFKTEGDAKKMYDRIMQQLT